MKNPLFDTLTTTGRFEELIFLLKIVDEVYLFRNGHWQFVQKYIMSNTKYPKATGGTPITSWLINQIEAVLKYEGHIIDALNAHIASNAGFIGGCSDEAQEFFTVLSKGYPKKRQMLIDQVALLQVRQSEKYYIFLCLVLSASWMCKDFDTVVHKSSIRRQLFLHCHFSCCFTLCTSYNSLH